MLLLCYRVNSSNTRLGINKYQILLAILRSHSHATIISTHLLLLCVFIFCLRIRFTYFLSAWHLWKDLLRRLVVSESNALVVASLCRSPSWSSSQSYRDSRPSTSYDTVDKQQHIAALRSIMARPPQFPVQAQQCRRFQRRKCLRNTLSRMDIGPPETLGGGFAGEGAPDLEY